jgi:CheY-like chemotaxis protein
MKRPVNEGRARKRVLVVEDNDLNSLLLQTMLKDQDVELDFAENGAEAIKKYEATSPDIVLMDIRMPQVDGLQAAREIRAMEAHNGDARALIIGVTADAFEENRQRCFDAGMDAYVKKPFSKKELVEKIQ